ncbi:MAG: beta-Ala-His dipeptidase [Promethearchaeota archaeon]
MEINVKELGKLSEFWEYFEKISKIPRCSGREAKIREFIQNEASTFNFHTKTDNVGNLLVKIPIKNIKKDQKKVCLQCHLDMVCEKNKAYEHDFLKDPLKLKLIKIDDEKWLTAEGTTLGADNGVGIAYCLIIMKKLSTGEINLGKIDLSFLFTVEEESGLLGAFNIDRNLIDCDYLINLDSENDETLTIGCAGGTNTFGSLEYEPDNVNETMKESVPYKLSITGLIGGHSGVDIHRGRINAIKLIGRILHESDLSKISLHSIRGGNRTNAIPRETEVIFFLDRKNINEFISSLEQLISSIKQELRKTEPNLQISLIELNNFQENHIIPDLIKNKLITLIHTLPNGPISMHPKFSNLVHTSTNLASINIDEHMIDIKTKQRSLEEISKIEIREKIKAEFEATNLNFEIKFEADYPGWNPNFNSNLLIKAKEKYNELFHKEALVNVVHAGLECGILKRHFPDIDMISFGPTTKDAHSPDESLQIKSIQKIWQFLIALIKLL